MESLTAIDSYFGSEVFALVLLKNSKLRDMITLTYDNQKRKYLNALKDRYSMEIYGHDESGEYIMQIDTILSRLS